MCYNRPNLKISPGQNNQGIKHPPWTKCPPGLVVLQPLLCQPNQSLLQEPIQNLGYFLNFRMSFTRPLGWQTSSRTDIQLKDIQLNRHPAAEWKSSRRIWHCHLHLVLLSRGHENFHDDMNMSAIITWSMTPTSLHLPPVLCLSLPSLLSPPSPFMLLNQVHPLWCPTPPSYPLNLPWAATASRSSAADLNDPTSSPWSTSSSRPTTNTTTTINKRSSLSSQQYLKTSPKDSLNDHCLDLEQKNSFKFTSCKFATIFWIILSRMSHLVSWQGYRSLLSRKSPVKRIVVLGWRGGSRSRSRSLAQARSSWRQINRSQTSCTRTHSPCSACRKGPSGCRKPGQSWSCWCCPAWD